MPLPKFDNLKSINLIMGDPIHSPLFEIHIDGEFLQEGYSYKVNTMDNKLYINFNINEDTLRNHIPENLKCNEIILLLHNRKGEVVNKMTFKNLEYMGCEFSGNWNSAELVSYKHGWSFKDYSEDYL